MLDESRFHAMADVVLQHCFAQLESAYDSGALDDLDLQGGILTMVSAEGKTFLLSKHAPSCQLWLASPLSGGLHFAYDGSAWRLSDGTELYAQLAKELASQQIMVTL